MDENNQIHYFTVAEHDELWGTVCTTAGYQEVKKNTSYPPRTHHPESHAFSYSNGRVLDEYQLIYIVEGEGIFESSHCAATPIRAGMMLFVFPNEWHRYSPNHETGWKGYWVGFKGSDIDERVAKGFFSKEDPIINIGTDEGVTSCYSEILHHARYERTGFQVMISSILMHLLGSVVFSRMNRIFENSSAVEKIAQARAIMKERLGSSISAQEIAEELGVSYTWLRHTFRDYVGIAPVQYILNLKLVRAKELLSNTRDSVSEIACALGFEYCSQFSAFFKSREQISPREYRDRYGLL